ncbi:MAG: large conductance mechanosensitive channel protein MscL [Anaeroplasmataceae bacterium]
MGEKKEKKGIFKEFKEFISRGNVVDLAVGMIIGSAFTAIVTALSNGIFKPIINWVIFKALGGKGLEDAYTFLYKAYQLDASGSVITDTVTGAKAIDLANSIYIDWGAFISAIINFLLVAIVLFIIVKVINSAREMQEKFKIEQQAKIEARKQEILAKMEAEEKEEASQTEEETK